MNVRRCHALVAQPYVDVKAKDETRARRPQPAAAAVPGMQHD